MSNLSNRPQNNPKINLAFFKASIEGSKERARKNRELYKQNPNCCKECDSIIPYEKQKNKFCNHSCKAKFNNRKRPKSIYKKQAETLKKKYKEHPELIINRKNWPYCKVIFKICPTCNNAFRAKKGNQIYCSKLCQANNSAKKYRQASKFYLNPNEYPELFNIELIEKYGWYQPTNKPNSNLTGVCWDHLYRISDGFKSNVAPEIISHPANAELVPFSINRQRAESLITLEELYERIKQWNSGNRNLKYFYFE